MIHLEDVENYDELGYKWVAALCTKLGGLENVKAILREELIPKLYPSRPKFFDKNGRRIPPRNLKNEVCDPQNSFRLIQPEIDYSVIITRLERSFINGKFLSAVEFQQQAEGLLAQLRHDDLLINLLKGIWLPICFPHLQIKNYKQSLESVFLPAVEISYQKQFPNRRFENIKNSELADQVIVAKESRHEVLLNKMEHGSVVGLLFFPFQGYSILAQRDQMASLPMSLLLCGAVDLATAMAAYPDVLSRDWNTPGYDCSAVTYRTEVSFQFFRASNANLKFDSRISLSQAYDRFTGGLLFLG